MSVNKAYEKFKNNKINEPILSFWFDDGFTGNRKYAYPILEKENVKAAVSINSKFLLREEMFWRCKLSVINFSDGNYLIRKELRKLNIPIKDGIKNTVLNNFSEKIITIIDLIYNEIVNEEWREDSFRIFDDIDGINFLQRNGWVIANHSSSHYPISEGSFVHNFDNEFLRCEIDIKKHLGLIPHFWVIPFDRPGKESSMLEEKITRIDKCFVFVGNRININPLETQKIYRIGVPLVRGRQLIKYLKTIS